MQRFTRLTAVAAPLARKNVNTDAILPARFMRKPRDDRYPDYLFHDLRFLPDGSENPDFVLNRTPWRGARILIADSNFGCGSSRETAVYALHDYGFRALIAPSFGDIFAANCIRNGLLPVRLEEGVVARLRDIAQTGAPAAMTVDLEAQRVSVPGHPSVRFEIDPFDRKCLLGGLDDIEVTLREETAIARFEADYKAEFAWLYGRRR